jgi:hypothetical protein
MWHVDPRLIIEVKKPGRYSVFLRCQSFDYSPLPERHFVGKPCLSTYIFVMSLEFQKRLGSEGGMSLI